MAYTRDKNLSPPASDIVFAENFRNNASVGNNGGTISGNPVINNGATLSGTGQYVTYPTPNTMIGTIMTFKFVFTPSFAHDDGVDHYFLNHASESGDTWYISKLSSNTLRVDWKFTAITVVAASYAAYWKINQRNVLHIVFGAAGQQAYLNGTLIGTGATGIVAAATTRTFRLGGSTAGADGFSGKMHEFALSKRALTAQEVLDDYNNSTYNYENKAILNLPMHDKIGSEAPFYTSDLSGFGNKEGAQLLTDGDMEAVGTSAWTVFSGSATLAKSAVSPYEGTQSLEVTSTGAYAVTLAYQTILKPGVIYHVTGRAKGNGSQAPSLGPSSGPWWYGTSSTDWQRIDGYYVTDRTDGYFMFGIQTNTGTVYFDNLRVTSIGKAVLGDGVTASTFPTKLTHRNGYSFDGGDYMTTTPDATLFSGNKLTMYAWVNDRTVLDSKMFLTYGDTNATYFVYNTASDEWKFLINNTGGWAIVTSRLSGTHLLVGTYDGTTSRFYVDGELVGLVGTGGATLNKGIFSIGTYIGNPGYGIIGDIYKVGLYNFDFTPTQIKDLYLKSAKYLG